MPELKRSLSLLLLCDTPTLIERALEHLGEGYEFEKKHFKSFSEWGEYDLVGNPLIFWSAQEEMALDKVLERAEGHPVFVIMDSFDIEAQRNVLKTEVYDVLCERRWPCLPEILERLFKKQKQRSYPNALQTFLQEIIQKNTDAVIGHDYKKITFINESLIQLLGYRINRDLIGQPLSKVVYLEDVPAHLTTQAPVDSQTSFEKIKQVRLIKKNGGMLRVNIQALILPMGALNPVVWQVKHNEDTWELVHRAVKEQSALLIKHADQAPGVVYQYRFFPLTERTAFTFVSDRLGDLTAIPVEELRKNGNIFFDYLHPDDFDNFQILGEKSMGTLGTWSMNFRLKAKGEGYRWMHASSKPVRLADDSVLWYGYMEDVTNDIQTKQDIRDSEAQVRTLFENAPDGIVILDANAVVVRWNPKAVEIFGWTFKEVVGRRLDEVVVPERYWELYNGNFKRFREGEDVFFNRSLEVLAHRKSGQEFPLMISISTMQSKGELYLLCFFEDITTRKQAQDKLQDSLKEKEVLLKEIHHRVKNNLQVITSLLSLQASFIEDSSISDIFKKSQYRINSMGMVHEMLYQSKDLAKINYQAYLERLTTSLKQAMVVNKQEIEVVLEVPAINLNVDTAIPLSLIINELVTNAFKYAFIGRTQGMVKLTLEALEAPKFLMRILDDGVGYSETLPVNRTPSLGLLLVRKLAMQLKGETQRISVEKGTEYHLLFEEITTT